MSLKEELRQLNENAKKMQPNFIKNNKNKDTMF
jgi:hypothetical protein